MATIIAIIAAVAFWLEYHENKLLNEAQFIADLNEQFISNEHMADVEWDLEKFYIKYDKGELTEEYCKEKCDINRRGRQYLVNYLVHLEGVAALVKSRVLHIPTMTDLMAYRYFIAVNNPVVQNIELLEYTDYYHGIFDIYDGWIREMKKQGANIPMLGKGEISLTKKRQLVEKKE